MKEDKVTLELETPNHSAGFSAKENYTDVAALQLSLPRVHL